MLKYFIAIFCLIGLSSCYRTDYDSRINTPYEIKVIVYDSCEYLQWSNANGTLYSEMHLIHKGNCKNHNK